MSDYVLDAIDCGLLNKSNISFFNIRGIDNFNRNVFGNLDRGWSILKSINEVDQYLYSYGKMINSQWREILKKFKFNPDFLQVIDYGCGQGLGSVLFFDVYGFGFRDSVKSVVLIEPSEFSLKRAESIVRCYCPQASVFSFKDKVNNFEIKKLNILSDVEFLHIFSNVLDVPGFDGLMLIKKILKTKGVHNIFAVSHDRNFIGGSWIFDEIIRLINSSPCIDLDYTEKYSFNVCVNGKESRVIGLFCQFEVFGE